MTGFAFSQEECLCFFAVLVRFSVLFSILPFIGDKMIPTPVKVLLSLAVSIALFPSLMTSGQVRAGDAIVWGSTTGSIVSTITLEVVFALLLGYVARMSFETIHFGANLVGTFMGFASASTYDPHQESHTQVVAEIQLAIAMLLFLAIDGHHIMLKAALESYRVVGVGGAASIGGIGGISAGVLSQKLIGLTSQVVVLGIQLASPVAIALFGVNVAFGFMGKAMPQMNIMVLSFAVSAAIGLFVMFMGMPEFASACENILGRMSESMEMVMVAVGRGK